MSTSTQAIPASIRAWQDADRRQQLELMSRQLSADVVLFSPLTDGFVFQGRREVMAVFAAAFDLLEDIEIEALTGSGNDWVLHGSNTLGGRNLEEVQWLTLNEDGLICQIRLFIRPMPAAVMLLTKIGRRLHAHQIMTGVAAVASATLAPVAIMLGVVERFVMPRLGPKRSSLS